MPELKEFQEMSVEKIFHALMKVQHPENRPRFLLADEVGLGKTIVAKGVIQKILQTKGNDTVNIIYFSCNLEIANQNYVKLFPDKFFSSRKKYPKEDVVQEVGRLTMYPFSKNHRSDLNIYSFTPGTSLSLGRSTGIIHERQKLYCLLMAYFGEEKFLERVPQLKNRRDTCFDKLLMCGASSGWKVFKSDIDSEIKDLSDKQYIAKKYIGVSEPVRFLNSLFDYYDQELLPEGKKGNGDYPRQAIFEYINGLTEKDDPNLMKERNNIIRLLREGLAIKSIEKIKPDLIIMDEFQKFEDLLYIDVNEEGEILDKDDCNDARHENKLVTELLTNRAYPVLLLSATPYKILDPRTNQHYKEFYRLLTMLTGDESIKNTIHSQFETYRGSLKDGAVTDDKNEALKKIITAKHKIEDALSNYICRTERYMFEDVDVISDRHLCDNVLENQLEFDEDHISEYFNIEAARLSRQIKEGKNLKKLGIDYWKSGQDLIHRCENYKWHESIFGNRNSRANEGITNYNRNIKIKYLINELKGMGKCLWVLPSSRVMAESADSCHTMDSNDPFTCQPRKFLVFSAWRFVPEMIADIVSKSVQVDAANRRPFADENLIRYFLHPDLIQFLNSDIKFKNQCLEAIIEDEKSSDNNTDSSSKNYEPLSKRFEHGLRLIEKQRTRKSENEAMRNYPGIALYNACMKYIYSPDSGKDYCNYLKLQIFKGSILYLRRYFEHAARVSIIDECIPEGTYPEKFEQYISYGHLGDVIDEYIFLLSQEILDETTDKLDELFETFKIALALREVTTKGRIALNFNTESSSSDTTQSERKRNIRIAFNSPFQPFVLATTSVGQEGLDFHHYCQDIIHWDLPHNPEDMEQREGRIRRFRSRGIRIALASDLLSKNNMERADFNWFEAFKTADRLSYCSKVTESYNPDYFKIGMYPDWVYTCGDDQKYIIRRHIMSYPYSNDITKYRKLNDRLKYFRMALGQNRTHDVIAEAEGLKQKHNLQPRELQQLAINLRPFDKKMFFNNIQNKLEKILSLASTERDNELSALIDLTERMLLKHKDNIKSISSEDDWNTMFEFCNEARLQLQSNVDSKQINRELFIMLYYFASPYDEFHDELFHHGVSDDVRLFHEFRNCGKIKKL